MSQSHKECTKDEIFVGNTAREGEHFQWLKSQGLTSARLGKVAYAIDGMPLPAYYAPVIIDRSQADLHHAIMMEKTFGPNWRRA
ncbi:hypothetical protein ACWGMK_06085 [Agrobacterium deltaense]